MCKLPCRLILILICLIFLWWFSSIIYCEVLTFLHWEEFDILWEETPYTDPEYWKILSYNDHCASVYYVSSNHEGGTVVYFVKNGKEWIFKNWGPSWSSSGSADDLIWPYFR